MLPRRVVIVVTAVIVPFLTEDEPSTPTTGKQRVKATEYECVILKPPGTATANTNAEGIIITRAVA